MTKYTLKVNGMKCPKCEAHANAAIARVTGSGKVTSSHVKCETVVIARDGIEEAVLRNAIAEAGYEVVSVTSEPCEKKGFFSFLKR